MDQSERDAVLRRPLWVEEEEEEEEARVERSEFKLHQMNVNNSLVMQFSASVLV